MEIYLIRHTEPQLSKGLIYGRTDLPLAPTFAEEKLKVISALPEDIEIVISSPSQRCLLLAQAISYDVIKDERLYELNFGDWEGKTWDTIDRQESEYWMEDYVNRRPPSGETMLEMKERVMACWEEIKAMDRQKIAIVTHGGVIRLLLAIEQQLPLMNLWDRKIAFGEVIRIKS